MEKYILDINDLNLDGVYNYYEYYHLWKFSERVELINGKIYPMGNSPGTIHQSVLGEISGKFYELKSKSKCQYYFAPFDVRFPNKSLADQDINNVVQPDLCIFCDKSKLDKRGGIGAPDLIVEIILPGNSTKEINEKFDLYEENGVKEYCIVNPAEKYVLIYILQNGKYIGLKPFTEHSILKSTIFPILKFKVEDIFKAKS